MDYTRRQTATLLGFGMVGFLSGCGQAAERVSGDGLKQAGESLPLLPGDVHTHLFNASDLPIEGFVRYVVARNPDGVSGGAVRALARTLRFLSRTLCVAAGSEFEIISNKREAVEVVSEETYANNFADFVEAGIGSEVREFVGKRSVEDSEGLAEGVDPEDYRELADTITQSINVAKGQDPSFKALTARSDEERIAGLRVAVAIAARNDGDIQSYVKRSREDADGEEGPFSSLTAADVVQTLAWMYGMMQPRRYHFETYLARMGSSEKTPVKLVNLLIDYDRWLDDRPARQSSQIDQLKYWQAYRIHVEEQATIYTFAPFDPLKAAEEKLRNKRPSLIDEIFRRFDASSGTGKPFLSGFKLYPPMGFAAYGNAGFGEDEAGWGPFAGHDGIGKLIENRWDRAFGGKAKIGSALDGALKDFFSNCLERDIPVLAHAGQSVYASSAFKDRMSPEHWSRLILDQSSGQDLSELRLCLGHFTHPAKFMKAVAELPETGEYQPGRNAYTGDVWALKWTGPLLWHSSSRASERKARVFTDISYMEELVAPDGKAMAGEFFTALRKYCLYYDPLCEGLTFGTDWIMLGREPNFDLYLERVEHGMTAAKWPDEWRHNFLDRNFDAFVNGAPR